ncbi:MAG: SH3 domain-containing protein [Luteimonas sp.]|nr:SH3 domain-containing protein [Luteimonas sp.]
MTLPANAQDACTTPAPARCRAAKACTLLAVALLVMSMGAATASGTTTQPPDDTGIVGVRAEHLSAGYWIRKARQVDRPVMSPAAIATQNLAMESIDPSLHDIEALPVTLEREQVVGWIEAISTRPTRTLYDEAGKEGSERALDRLVNALDLRNVPQTQVTRYGMVVSRADLRTFPTHLRVFSTPEDRDIDRFQESALFPGTPVVVAHESRDGEWLFVVSRTYAAWIDRDAVAIGDKAEIFAHARRSPHIVVTGATVSTVHARTDARVSEVQLDMGVRMPLVRALPEDGLVNGQHPYFGHAIELPIRNEDGSLSFAPALIPASADVASDYLPMTRANILRQAFKFLGERYGWGHSFNSRDCSGFVAEVYRSFGVLLPRNTSAQAVSPALNRLQFDPAMPHDERVDLLRKTQVGDLVYIPGHVMMVIGHEDGEPYVIHDTAGMSYRGPDGDLRRLVLNGVVVTPLLPMLSDADTATIERITNIQRIRP